MKKILLILAFFLVASCTSGKTETNSGTTNTGTTTEISQQKEIKLVRYVRFEDKIDGKVVETNIEEIAKTHNIYVDGQVYEALPVDMNIEGGVIKGFKDALIDMKKGDTKSIEVSPKDGYGEATITQDVHIDDIRPVQKRDVPLDALSDESTQTIEKASLTGKDLEEYEKEFTGKKVGDVLQDDEYATITVKEITPEKVVLRIINKINPFSGKKLEVGTEASDETATYKIAAINGPLVTLEITDKMNPFYNVDIVAGAEVDFAGGKVKILSLDEATGKIKLERPNTEHPMAGKTLYFTLTVEDIKTE